MKKNFFFPLIAAVLLNEQEGVVYADDNKSPTQAYVEHAFGFAQIFGASVNSFELELEDYLLFSKCFNSPKIRLYTPFMPKFIELPKYKEHCSYRQRFVISALDLLHDKETTHELKKNISIREVDSNNISHVNNKFDVVGRFWRNKSDFVQKSKASIVYYKGDAASICYSAATANNCVEIDVFTLPEYRRLGLAKLGVVNFVNRCFTLSLSPFWDCFTNNTGSMKLCTSVGFIVQQEPYPFYTFNKY